MMKAVITDIEGTTSSISFVKDVLFPYARMHLGDFIRNNIGMPEVKALLQETAKEIGNNLDTELLIKQLIGWLDEDKKITPLKSLQGLIWEAGYQRGDFTGHLYPDAVENLKSWKAQGIDLYIYSSGSVYAQKLLFGHTDYGDLTPLFSGHFDTCIGGKRETSSYLKIAEQIKEPTEELLFLSDTKEELDAAKAAGFKTIWLNRNGMLDAKTEHLQVQSFGAIRLGDV
jgi:enolase-phosphatase E1